MAKEFSRAQRIGDQIQRELAQLIRLEVKDPRLGGLVTITAVEVSRDSSHAKVFVTIMGAEPEVPNLRFHYDESVIRGAQLSALIERAVSEDRQHEDEPEAKE